MESIKKLAGLAETVLDLATTPFQVQLSKGITTQLKKFDEQENPNPRTKTKMLLKDAVSEAITSNK